MVKKNEFSKKEEQKDKKKKFTKMEVKCFFKEFLTGRIIHTLKRS